MVIVQNRGYVKRRKRQSQAMRNGFFGLFAESKFLSLALLGSPWMLWQIGKPNDLNPRLCDKVIVLN